MTPERWRQITGVFHAALARGEAGARAAFLEEACADDAALRADVESMLDAHRDAGTFGEPVAVPAGEPRLQEGAALGPYRIDGLIGAGGMGEVYRAHDPRLERDVAIKVLTGYAASDPDARRRLLREARAAAALNHPYVCTIHEVGESEGQAYIAMELLDGQSLDRLVPAGGFPLDRALRYGLQIAEAVAHAHDRGIVHRDLKPANTVITPQGHAKVLDFGLARRFSGGGMPDVTRTQSMTTAPGVIVGTLAYMAPEQLRGEQADARSDVWAIGVLLYELITGARPFDRDNNVALSAAIVGEAPQPLPGTVPPDVREVIERCLAKTPDERYQSAGELAAAIEARRAGVPIARRRFNKRILLLAGAAAFAVAGLTAVAGIDRVRGWLASPAASAPAPIRLAVLPFSNLTGDPAQEYFSDGLTEEMIAQLGRLHPQRLTVIGRTSAMRYKRTDKAIDQIGRELGVDYILEGSARREGGRVRITAQLVQASDQTQKWGDTYERELAGMFALQNDVARGVASSLALALLPAEENRLTRIRAINPDAYESYLKGRFHWYKMTPQDLNTAVAYFERALKSDPTYALAHIGWADALATRAHIGLLPATEVFPRALEAVDKALAIDNTLAEAHDLRARMKWAWEWKWNEAEQGFRRAIELNPNYPDVRAVHSQFLEAVGRPQQAIAEAQRATEVDPHNPWFLFEYGDRLANAGSHDLALAQFGKVLKLEPNSPQVHRGLWNVYFRKGMRREALEAAANFFRHTAQADIANALGSAGGDYTRAMIRAAEALTERSRSTYVAAAQIARLHAFAGDSRKAIQYLQIAVEQRHTGLVYIVADPAFESLRRDAGFRDVLRQIGAPVE